MQICFRGTRNERARPIAVRAAIMAIGASAIVVTAACSGLGSRSNERAATVPPAASGKVHAEQAGPASFRVGFVPSDGQAEARSLGEEFAHILSERIGRKVEPYVSEDYGSLISAMKDHRIDFAFFTAATFVQAERDAKAKPLLKKAWATPFYRSVLLVRAKSSIRSLEQLKGKKVAFVDRQSASGYLYPMRALRAAVGEGLVETRFSGSHPASVELLKSGAVDAIAVYAHDPDSSVNAWTERSGAPSSTARAIWTSRPIPGDPFCVRADFYEAWPRAVHELMYAMIELQEDPAVGARFMRAVGAGSLSYATARQYDSIREVVAGARGEPLSKKDAP